MPLTLWTPIDDRPRYLCHICGSWLLSLRSYELHTSKCAKEHEAELERFRHVTRDNVLHQDADPEYRKWQKDNPDKAQREVERLIGGTP
jgi:hypothetical protein